MPFLDQVPKDLRVTRWNAVGAVYGVLNAEGTALYIGRTDGLARRLSEHLADAGQCLHQRGAVSAVAEVIATESERMRREAQLIAEYNPPCNVEHPWH